MNILIKLSALLMSGLVYSSSSVERVPSIQVHSAVVMGDFASPVSPTESTVSGSSVRGVAAQESRSCCWRVMVACCCSGMFDKDSSCYGTNVDEGNSHRTAPY